MVIPQLILDVYKQLKVASCSNLCLIIIDGGVDCVVGYESASVADLGHPTYRTSSSRSFPLELACGTRCF